MVLNNLLTITDGMVPGEAQFKKEVGLPSWFSKMWPRAV